jgi:hypothetical protein
MIAKLDDKTAALTKIILNAVEALNEGLDEASKIVVHEDMKLFGPDSSLDSLSLVSVIVDVETMVADSFDQAVSLTDDRAMLRDEMPFADVHSLVAYLIELLTDVGV